MVFKIHANTKAGLQGKGIVYVVGTGDCGQLGLGENVPEKLRPGIVELPNDETVSSLAGCLTSRCQSRARDSASKCSNGCVLDEHRLISNYPSV